MQGMNERELGQHHLRQWREARGISQRRLADSLPLSNDGNPILSYASISRIERGEQPFPETAMAAVARALDVTVPDLFNPPPADLASRKKGLAKEGKAKSAHLPTEGLDSSFARSREDLLLRDILKLFDKYGIDTVYRQIQFARKAAQLSVQQSAAYPRKEDEGKPE